MRRLTPPEPDIELYKERFNSGKDLLQRTETGQALSNLVERIDEPMVVALDGGWGEGKSFFLKCWVGAHFLNDEYSTQTVYFDAFENDYADEPLISLVGCIADRFPPSTVKKTKEKAVGAMKALAMPIARITMNAVTRGASDEIGALIADQFQNVEHAEDIAKGLMADTNSELSKASETFWQKEDIRRKAMDTFKATLKALTEPEEDGTPTQKLVIVVDELDRCRPDYALSLLEIIKHFFDVPGVHFVLGVNMRELENSVKARYGTDIDAGLYLQKFVTLKMQLPRYGGSVRQSNGADYFDKMASKMEMLEEFKNWGRFYLSCMQGDPLLTPRASKRILTQLAATPVPKSGGGGIDGTMCFFATGFAISKVLYPELLDKAQKGDLSLGQLPFFQKEYETIKHEQEIAKARWSALLSPEKGWSPVSPLEEEYKDSLSAINRSRNLMMAQLMRSQVELLG